MTGPGGAGPMYRVDPAKIDALRNGLLQKIDDLRDELRRLQSVNFNEGPGPDPHSVSAMKQMHDRAVGDKGCFSEAIQQYQQAIHDTVDRLDAAKKAYEQNDQSGAQGLNRGQV